jgi:TolA-binding protein
MCNFSGKYANCVFDSEHMGQHYNPWDGWWDSWPTATSEEVEELEAELANWQQAANDAERALQEEEGRADELEEHGSQLQEHIDELEKRVDELENIVAAL